MKLDNEKEMDQAVHCNHKHLVQAAMLGIVVIAACCLVEPARASSGPWYKILENEQWGRTGLLVDGTDVYSVSETLSDYNWRKIDQDGNIIWKISLSLCSSGIMGSLASIGMAICWSQLIACKGNTIAAVYCDDGTTSWTTTLGSEGGIDLVSAISNGTHIFIVGSTNGGMLLAIYNYTGYQEHYYSVSSASDLRYTVHSACKIGQYIYTAGVRINTTNWERIPFIACWNENGTYLWNQTYLPSLSAQNEFVAIGSDGSWLYPCGRQDDKPVVMRMYLNGTINWTMNLNMNDVSDLEVYGGSLYIAGTSEILDVYGGMDQVSVVRILCTGQVLWERTWTSLLGIGYTLYPFADIWSRQIEISYSGLYISAIGRFEAQSNYLLIKFDDFGVGPAQPILIGFWYWALIVGGGVFIIILSIVLNVKKKKNKSVNDRADKVRSSKKNKAPAIEPSDSDKSEESEGLVWKN